MRTTVEIPDALFRRAKLAAVEQGTTLRELVTRGLEAVLRGGNGRRSRLAGPPVTLSEDSPLRTLGVGDVDLLDVEAEAGELDEVYRRR